MSGASDNPLRILLLGGTAEAAALARAIPSRFGAGVQITTSLAGRTERPVPVPGAVRIGGFGGSEGLADYLRAEEIAFVIDATHPFAARISAHARAASEALGLPRLMLLRPPWRRQPLDRWIEVEDAAAAAAIVGKLGRRAFLTVGAGDIAAFAGIEDVRFLVRLVAPPRQVLPLRFHTLILGRGPFTLAEERHLLQRHAIEVLVTKASGGAATEAKLAAAREASLPVVMLRRPPAEPGEAVASVEGVLAWLETRIGGVPPQRASRS